MGKRLLRLATLLALVLSLAVVGGAYAVPSQNDGLQETYIDLGLTQWGGNGPETTGESSLSSGDADYDGASAAILQGLKNVDSSIYLGSYNITLSEISDVAYDVIESHPELFYVQSGFGCSYYTSGGKKIIQSIRPYYVEDDVDSITTMKVAYEAKIAEALSWIPSGASQAEQLKAVHDWLYYNVAYDSDVLTDSTSNLWAWSSYGAMVVGKAVCQGYSLAYLDLCNRLGITCKYVHGMSNGTTTDIEGNTTPNYTHGWNAVQLDGYWYFVDVTWDDPLPDGVLTRPRSTYFLKDETAFEDHEDWDFSLSPSSSQYASTTWTIYTAPAAEHMHVWQTTGTSTNPCYEKVTYECLVCGTTYESGGTTPSHVVVTQPAVAATCTETGLTEGQYCSRCGEVIKEQEVVPALGHKWDSGTVTTPATCDAAGVRTYTCENDPSHTYTESIAATGHKWDGGAVTEAATCDSDGVMTYTCENDPTHTYTETISALGHKWNNGTVTSEPTCEAAGVITYTCANDATHTYTEAYGSALGHDWGEWSSNGDATCEADGTKTRACSRCGATETAADEGSATGHKWDGGTVTTPATCTAAGVRTYTCENDGAHTYTEAIPATGHAWDGGVVTTPATCDAAGTITYTCKNDSAHTYTEAITATGHKWDGGTVTEAATCDSDGVMTYTCENDGSHTYTESIAALGHKWGTGVVTTPATCETDGVITYTCANNSAHTYTEAIAATGHKWSSGTVTRAATCDSDGVRTYTCENDGSHTYTETIPAIGHSWDNGVVTLEPTCEAAGVRTYTCANDPSHTYTEAIPAAGHKWNNGTVTRAATCTEDGVITYTCEDDPAHAKTEAVPALGGSHSWGAWTTTKAPTDKSDGAEERACSRCGATEERSVAAYTGVEAFAYRLYAEVLGREPDADGFKVQVGALERGASPAEIAYNYFNSEEYFSKHESVSDTVERVYRVMFGRDSDEAGKAFWVSKMADGMSVRAVVAGFSQADEYRAYFGSLGLDSSEIPVYDANADKAWDGGDLAYAGGNDRDRSQGVARFAKRLYTAVLGREDSVGTEGGIDVSGLNAQCRGLRAGISCWSIAYNFFNSAEFAGHRYTSEQVVRIAYAALLGRDQAAIDKDKSGIAYWVKRLEKNGLEDMVRGFCQSDEFEAICRDCGMTSGMR